MNKQMRRAALYSKLMNLRPVLAAQMDDKTDSVGITFGYLGVTYTAYIDAETERGELLQHDSENIESVTSVGVVSAEKLVNFFSRLPKLESIVER